MLDSAHRDGGRANPLALALKIGQNRRMKNKTSAHSVSKPDASATANAKPSRARHERPPDKTAPVSESVLITQVAPKSLAAKAGITPGGRILSINGKPVRDVLDFLFHTADDSIRLKLLPPDAPRPVTITLKEDGRVPLGITVEELKTIRCENNCVFCFVAQNPPGLREAIYLKDDDYRMSFTHGQYITATSLGPDAIRRIAAQRLSPLYISVHVF